MGSSRANQMVAKAIVVRLARIGQTRSWLAEQLGVGPMWVSNRITGQVAIDLDDVERIAGVLGMASGMELLSLAQVEAESVSA